MQFKITDPNAHALIEVEITLHPEALRQAITGRRGWIAGWLHALIILSALYFAIAFEVTLPRCWLELRFHPLPLVAAYIAWRYGITRGCIAALSAALAYSAWLTLQLPQQCIITILAAALPAIVLPALPLLRKCGWRSAALIGAIASFVYCSGELFVNLPMPAALFFKLFANEVCFAALINAVIYAPLLFVLLDFLTLSAPLFAVCKNTHASSAIS